MTDAPTSPALDLERIERLAEAATPGPWRHHKTATTVSVMSTRRGCWGQPWAVAKKSYDQRVVRSSTKEQVDADINYLAALDPSTVLALVAAAKERDKLRDLLMQARSALEDGDAQDEMARMLQAEEDSWSR